MVVYFYFAVSLVGRQWVQVTKQERKEGLEGVFFSDDPYELDLYFPIFLTFEFLFYVGWLNVAAALYNPFGDDDDDFAVMGLLNRHIKVCMKIVDDDKDDIPEVREDEFWKAPPGAPLNWQPCLDDQNTPPLDVKVVKTESESEMSSPSNWSEIRNVVLDQEHDEE